MNELHFIYRVRQHLNRGLHELRPETTDRLAAARERALARQKQTVHQSVLATAGSVFQMSFESPRLKQIVAGLALAACVVTASFWAADRRVNELSEIDSALLSDELPISAFIDKGFSAWLKQDSQQ
jgi:predicted signal transduction protein with EAL and GGDEF domain